jgi:hypothetical protein
MTTKVKSILSRSSTLLNDEEHTRWEEAELLGWLNDGQRAIAKGPATDAYVIRDNLTAVAGSVQTLPNDGIRLVDVVRNVSGGTPILQSDYAMVDILGGAWRAAASGIAENFFYNENNPKQFELYPPQAGGESIELVYNAQPADAVITGNIIIDDMYGDALINYIVYRGFSKDTEDSSPELSRATAFYRAFLLSTGQKDATDQLIEPRRS